MFPAVAPSRVTRAPWAAALALFLGTVTLGGCPAAASGDTNETPNPDNPDPAPSVSIDFAHDISPSQMSFTVAGLTGAPTVKIGATTLAAGADYTVANGKITILSGLNDQIVTAGGQTITVPGILQYAKATIIDQLDTILGYTMYFTDEQTDAFKERLIRLFVNRVPNVADLEALDGAVRGYMGLPDPGAVSRLHLRPEVLRTLRDKNLTLSLD
jgi:hypothetical protein